MLNKEKIDPINELVTMKMPSDVGITGYVNRTDEIYICQCTQKDQKYHCDVDNLGGGNTVNNMMVGPIYGYSPDGHQKKHVGIL